MKWIDWIWKGRKPEAKPEKGLKCMICREKIHKGETYKVLVVVHKGCQNG